jgi:hypothetical protein
MEDLKKIQEFFSKPVKENSRRSPDFILTEPAEIKYTESFGTGIKAPGVLHHANEGAFLGAEGAYIIVLPGGTFYVDEDKEEAMPIWPLKDQTQELHQVLDYTPFSPKYETWKSWIKRPDVLDEEAVEEYNTGIYYNPTKDDTSDKTKDAAKSGLKKVRDFIQKVMKEEEITVDDATEFKINLKHLLDKHAITEEEGEDPIDTITMDVPLFIRVLEYAKEDAETDMDLHDLAEKAISATKQQGMLSMDDYDMLVGELKQIGMEEAEEEGYSQYLKTDDNPEGKTKGLDTKTMNKILMNVIKDLDELKQLGEGVIEEELCAKGKAYRKKRMAAGEKSSAYLSGRAVKVCKGQMKG